MGVAVIQLEGVSKVYGLGEAATVALDDVTLTIQKGEFVAIMGPSGSGKSTLMNIIGLLDRPTYGSYKLDGKNVAAASQRKRAALRRDKIGFIFQSFNLLPRINAVENVSLPLIYKGMSHVKRLEKAAKIMEKVGLHDRQYYMPGQLSGGQIQRVAIARALVNNPSIVLADEPTGNLDTTTSETIMKLLVDIHEGGNTVVMITHNAELAAYAERIVTVVDGRIDSDVAVSKKPGSHRKKPKDTK